MDFIYFTLETLQRHKTEVGARWREKYPKHDNRESAENKTIEMGINSPQLPVSN
jgi:hypothetical protein